MSVTTSQSATLAPASVRAPFSAEDTAARVLRQEGEALIRFAHNLPADFGQAVAEIIAATGRIILSGMGKSGHIARKIAATLASTGTPAFFVHPAEASHGDLGMVAPGDICILISNSGETSELSDLIAHCARFSITLIGISKRPNSTLMRAADLQLTLPDLPEVCSIGMAPTTSTTLTLGLGDALAVALMEARGFRPDEFHVFHPGGKLGARLARVGQLMHGPETLPLISRNSPMSEAVLEISARGFGIVGVINDGGGLYGVISDGDLRRNMDGLLDRRADDVCTRLPVTVTSDTLAAEALAVMTARKISALFVLDAGERPVGILHIHDCLRAGIA
ncbi:KpsF/GutQ family sugar-phosphate isomerase (plasmid) [Cereibacter azotoformans]|uniref:KpsF/GutQ family sugar-phosphate isomerase n=1 Tax=Cereibacter azotoformans TaxID=43057 RepID=UPI001EEA9132|nr:KpsF/GutQ family sugar-phosphate isomerase [Cereibacter azotoformans]ULB12057.1 KpsF/GutQ family sugar-phosphate isomerase [Cereibacter azotoformans]